MQDLSEKDTLPLPNDSQQSGIVAVLKKFLREQKSLSLAVAGAIFWFLLLLHTLQRNFWPQSDGVFGFAASIAPYLFLPMLLLLPLCFLRRHGLMRIILLLTLVLFGLCFPPHLSSAPQAPAGSKQIRAMTWNFHADNKRGGSLRQVLAELMPDIVAIQEANPAGLEQADDILQAYPYNLYKPSSGLPPGEVILSKFPILAYGVYSGPRSIWDIDRVLWARLDLGQGKTLTVVNAHPISAVNTTYGCFYCPHLRDKQIQDLHLFMTKLLQQGGNVLLLGDMNITDRESSYSELAQGLRDTHLVVGNGPGHSWGLGPLNRFWAFVRIDYMFISPKITPLALITDCEAVGSAHCALLGRFAIE